MSEEKIFIQLKERMIAYDKDFHGAIKRSEEIVAEDRSLAVKKSNDMKALERFGVII